MTGQTVILSVSEGVAQVTLNRPEKLNSFTRIMHAELRAALDSIDRDSSVRAILLTGNGRGFCAGQDLEDILDPVSRAPGPVGPTLKEDYAPLVQRLHDHVLPVVCAVNGVAAGAGASIAFACDIVLAARSASFVQAFVKIGLVPDAGGSYFLPRIAGTARALGLTMLGDKLDAETAAQWGLIWRCCDDQDLMPESRNLAVRLAGMPTLALGLIKKQIRGSVQNNLVQQLELETELQERASRSHDHREGVAAFLQKRPPSFKGN